MEAVSTSSCLCCGVATLDYLEHLLELHKFSLARARAVMRTSINQEERSTISKETEMNTSTLGNSSENVFSVGGVPIKIPKDNSGRPINLHFNINGGGAFSVEKGKEGIEVVPKHVSNELLSPPKLSPQKSLEPPSMSLPKPKLTMSPTITKATASEKSPKSKILESVSSTNVVEKSTSDLASAEGDSDDDIEVVGELIKRPKATSSALSIIKIKENGERLVDSQLSGPSETKPITAARSTIDIVPVKTDSVLPSDNIVHLNKVITKRPSPKIESSIIKNEKSTFKSTIDVIPVKDMAVASGEDNVGFVSEATEYGPHTIKGFPNVDKESKVAAKPFLIKTETVTSSSTVKKATIDVVPVKDNSDHDAEFRNDVARKEKCDNLHAHSPTSTTAAKSTVGKCTSMVPLQDKNKKGERETLNPSNTNRESAQTHSSKPASNKEVIESSSSLTKIASKSAIYKVPSQDNSKLKVVNEFVKKYPPIAPKPPKTIGENKTLNDVMKRYQPIVPKGSKIIVRKISGEVVMVLPVTNVSSPQAVTSSSSSSSVAVMQLSLSDPSAYKAKDNKRKHSGDGEENGSNKRRVGQVAASDQKKEMFNYPRLSVFANFKERHRCKICGDKIENTKDDIHRHVMENHNLNIVQYHSLYYTNCSSSSVSILQPYNFTSSAIF